MADWNWYYTQHGQRMGPVTLEQLQWMIRDGQVQEKDLAWTDGMAQWTHVSGVPELQSHIPVAVNTATASDASIPTATIAEPVAYFTPVTALPPRAKATLAGHANPTGDASEWPVDDARLAQLEQAARLRKRITAAAQLYRMLLALCAIFGLIFLIGGAVSYSGTAASRDTALGLIIFAVFCAGFSILYYFTWRATMRSQRWAPMTMLSLFLVSLLGNLIFLVIGLSTQPAAAVSAAVGVLIAGAFAGISIRAFVTIPKYLAQPVWCQELLVKARM